MKQRHSSTVKLLEKIVEEEVESKSLLRKITIKKNQLLEAKRLLKRKKVAGRRRLIDEEDERFLEKCIAEKTTAHGHRYDVVLLS